MFRGIVFFFSKFGKPILRLNPLSDENIEVPRTASPFSWISFLIVVKICAFYVQNIMYHFLLLCSRFKRVRLTTQIKVILMASYTMYLPISKCNFSAKRSAGATIWKYLNYLYRYISDVNPKNVLFVKLTDFRFCFCS